MEALIEFLAKLSPSFLFEDPRPVQSPLYLAFLGAFIVALVAGLDTVLFSERLSRGNRLARQILDRYGRWLAWVGALGILAVGLRYANVVLFSKRLWTTLDFLLLLGVLGHLIWYLRLHYPAESAAYQDAERRRKFAPGRRAPIAPRRASRH